MTGQKRNSGARGYDLSTLPPAVTVTPDQWKQFALAAAELALVTGGGGSTSTTGVTPPEKLLADKI
jgi:hypothetical protein